MSILQKVNSKANIRKTSSADLPYQPEYPVYIESYTEALKPAANTVPYKIIYASDLKQIQISDGSNWNPSAVSTYTTGTLPVAGIPNQYQIAFISDTLQVKISNGTEWKTIGSRLDTYTNATIPAAASNTNSLIWVSDLQQVQVSNGTSWVQVGSKAGTKNYFSQNNANPDFETGSTSPWSACTLTFSSGVPSGAPTLTATNMAISVTSTTPLAGTYSMVLTKSAANAQYQGFISSALTIDREDTAKVLYGSFNYELVSGTIDLSGSSTQSLEIWIYNTVSGQWTQPAGYRGMNQSSGVGKVVFSFQTDGTFANNSYQIAVFTQQTSTSAYVVKFDDFAVGPEAIVLSAPMTDWVNYTPSLKGSGSDPNIGSTGIIVGKWRRVGDTLHLFCRAEANGTGILPGSGTYYFTLPSGLSIDTAKAPSFPNATAPVGVANLLNQGSAVYQGGAVIYNSTGVGVTYDGATYASSTSPAANWFNAAGDLLDIFCQVPIAGWSSNVQTSSDTDTRVVAATRNTFSSLTVTSLTALQLTVSEFDTHSAFISNSTYKTPMSGIYSISLAGISKNSAAGSVAIQVYVNGLSRGTLLSLNDTRVGGSLNLSLIAGDEITIVPTGSTTLSSTVGTLSINRLSGPSVITATETVACEYVSTAGNSISSTTLTFIDFPTKQSDTHNSVVGSGSGNNTTATSTWRYVVPVSGKYQVNALVTIVTASSALSDYIITICVDGTPYSGGNRINATAANTGGWGLTASGVISLNAGQYISVRCYQSSGGSSRLQTTEAGTNRISIVRVGN